MLERLVIRDLALVDRAEVAFGPGLNVVTGETGAGKSLLVQAVNLLIGGRADFDAVRDGASGVLVDGEFRLTGSAAARARAVLEGWGHDFDGETVIVRREVQAGGRSRASVNQSPVTLAALRELGEVLVDLHGQHEHQSLLRPGAALEALDRLARLEPERRTFTERVAAWQAAAAAHARLDASLRETAERREAMVEARREIGEANLREGEEESLRGEAMRLRHADRLRELVRTATDQLSEAEGSAVDQLNAASHALDQAASLDPTLADLLPAVEEARIAAGEASRALSSYAADLEADPAALESIEARRELLTRLQRKYRRDVTGLIAWHKEIGAELAASEDGEHALQRARDDEARTRDACVAAGRVLSRKRHAAAGQWTARLTRDLRPLGFASARLEFEVTTPEPLVRDPLATGMDEVAIQFSANAGEAPRPLHKVVSGGELSRIMLALKVALEAQDPVDVLLFDEVDSGIGGAVAQAVGEQLRRLASRRQLICVTHLPMIAALASHHLRVTKRSVAGRTVARVEAADGEARIDELSRMLAGGKATETTRRQARELLGEPSLKSAVP